MSASASASAPLTERYTHAPHPLLYAAIHSARVVGYAPLLISALYRWPRRAAGAVAGYYSLRLGSQRWRDAVVAMVARGSSRQPRLLRAQTAPYDAGRQYLLCSHPHGILNYGWWNLIARFGGPSARERMAPLLDGLKLVMCMAPAVGWYPLYGEIFEGYASDASPATVRKILSETPLTVGLIPGGFSEAVWTSASPDVEYAYIADRRGFVKLAIEYGIDIIPTYTFGLNDMYETLGWARHWRGVKAQALGLPLLLWWGPWLLGNSPKTEAVTVCTFDPFPTSKYSLDQVTEAHADYMAYLKACFDSRKAECGAAHKQLEFIGRSKPPAAMAPRAKL